MKVIVGNEYNLQSINYDEGIFQGKVVGIAESGSYEVLITAYNFKGRDNSRGTLIGKTIPIRGGRILSLVAKTNKEFASLLLEED